MISSEVIIILLPYNTYIKMREIWQAIFWTYQEYDMETYQIALVEYIFREYERVRWNKYQKRLSLEEISLDNRRIWNIEINKYDWDWESDLPNFKYKDYWFWRYKYPWRWMTINKKLNEKQSIEMFNEIINYIYSLDKY